MVIPPFARATVVLPQAVMQMQPQLLDLCPQPLPLQEILTVENSSDRGWSAVSMQSHRAMLPPRPQASWPVKETLQLTASDYPRSPRLRRPGRPLLVARDLHRW